MKNLHLNNSSKSKQSIDKFAMDLLTQIMEHPHDDFQISIDDGDGDIWKYTISVDCDRVKEVRQITEN